MKTKQTYSRTPRPRYAIAGVSSRLKLMVSSGVRRLSSSVPVFLLVLGFVSVMIALSTTSTSYAAAPKCYENVERYQNTYNVDTGEITRGFPETGEVNCSDLRDHGGTNLKNDKCYVLRTILIGLSPSTQTSQWVEEADCNTEKKCAEEYNGIPVRATPTPERRNNVRLAAASPYIELAIDGSKCNATQASINQHCPSCMSPDDVPQDTQDYIDGYPEETAYCNSKGYTQEDKPLELQACIYGYRGDACTIDGSGEITDQDIYDACAVGREGGGYGPPPGPSGSCSGSTNILGGLCGSGVEGLLALVLDILTAGVGIAAVGGLAYGAFLYTTAADNQSQVQKAKEIIRNVIIGLVAYVSLYAFAQFILPGGAF